MQKFVVTGLRRSYSSSSHVSSTPQVAAAAQLVVNFCTPHQPILKKKAVSSVSVPGSNGEFGITAGHSALISQLVPGVVQVNHLTVSFLLLSRTL